MVHFIPKKKECVKKIPHLFQTLLAVHAFTKTKKLPRAMFRISRGQTDSRAGNAIRIPNVAFNAAVLLDAQTQVLII
jgi:hypothetical protein